MLNPIKSLALIALSVVALTGTAREASAFMVLAQAQITPNMITGQVYNEFPRPMRCSVRVNGLRNDGFVQTAWAQITLMPGAFEYAYVYTTNYPLYFINGEAFADCHYLF